MLDGERGRGLFATPGQSKSERATEHTVLSLLLSFSRVTTIVGIFDE